MKITLSDLPSFYINMEYDKNRRKRFMSWNKKMNFKNVSRIPGISTDPYYIGLSSAHANSIEAGIKTNTPFIVFEDDAAPTKFFTNEIEVPDDADAVYVGVSPWCSKSKNPKDLEVYNGSLFQELIEMPKVFRVHRTLSCHAIIYISKDYSESIYKLCKISTELKVHLDINIYKSGSFDKYNVYAVGPLFYQNDKNKPEVLKGTRDIDMKNLSIDALAKFN